MADYINPTGSISGTGGNDTITFNTAPALATSIDALAGSDTLTVDITASSPETFDVAYDNSGSFSANFSLSSVQVVVSHVENVQLTGTANNDTFHLKLGSSTAGLVANFDGGSGVDSLDFDWSQLPGNFNFTLFGSTVTSTFGTFTNFENFTVHGGSGANTIVTGSGNDTIVTAGGNDNITTGTGVDGVSAGAGNDQVYSQSSGGTFDGGDGVDYINWSSAGSSPLSVTIGANTQISNGIVMSNFEIESLGGGTGDDLFTMNQMSLSDQLYGGAGHDTLVFNAPYTTGLHFSVVAYSGDQLDGQIAVDQGNYTTYSGFESVAFTGTQFNDQFSIRADYSANTSAISFDGGAGTDMLTADFSLFAGASTLTVGSDGSISSNRGQFSNIEVFALTGGSGADNFVGGSGNDTLAGGAGADHLQGGAGDDTLYSDQYISQDDGAPDVLLGGAGNDTIAAGYGDMVDGGTGNDLLYFNASSGSAGITANFAQLTSGGTITIAGATLTGIEQMGQTTGTNYNDTIIAGTPGPNGDTVYGLAGDDHITGSSSADTIYGGDGNDTITGGLGADTLSGGDGNDTFIDTKAGLNGDTISDFTLGDTIIITDANLTNFTYSVSGGTLTYTGGSVFIGSQPGKIVASAAAGGGVQLHVQLAPVGTEDQIANELYSGYWNGDVHHWAVSQGGTLTVDIHTLTAAEQNLALAALQEWTDIIGVNFQQVTSGAQIVFDQSEDPSGPIAATDGTWSNGIITSEHVHISSSWVNDYGASLDSYSFQTYIHEIGHALGLGHPGNYNDTAAFASDAMFQNDCWANSVMSYFDQGESYYFNNQHFNIFNAVTPMQADILAMQTLYGLSTTTRTGDTVYGDHSNAGGIYEATAYPQASYTIFDSGGNDTIDYSQAGGIQLINLNPETFSNVNGYIGNLSIASGVLIENAIGSYNGDTLIGNSADNVLTGNGGADTLSGGGGNDTFKDTEAGHNGDTITDFNAGDTVLFTDATPGSFTFSLSGHTLTYSGGSMTIDGSVAGKFTATASASGGVQLAETLTHAVPNDFNSDGRSDLLLGNDNGSLAEWTGQSNGSFVSNANANYALGTAWHVVGTGDFNGDGHSDLLLRNNNGSLAEWTGQADGSFVGNANVNYALDTSWHIAGSGDFNGDGISDIVLRNDNGMMAEWNGQSSGGFVGNANVNYALDTAWQVAGTGDFNGDGISDVLLRNTNGMMAEWDGQSNGSFVGNAAVNYPLNTAWHVDATGDFNGDGIDDLLLRNDNGMMAEWTGQSGGGFVGNAAVNYPLDPAWHIAEVGDFNADGRADILLRNTNGMMAEWNGQPNGGFVGNAAVNYPLGTDWHVQDPFVHDALV